MFNGNEIEFRDQPEASLADMVFGFLEDGEGSPATPNSEEYKQNEILNHEDEEQEKNSTVDENRSFWENQHQLLQVNLKILLAHL